MSFKPKSLSILSVAAIALLFAAGAQAQNGTLKVSSFPSGAQVWVDGENTNKVTPMSVSLSVGQHTVVVRIPNSGWLPDQRMVRIHRGYNDLSVTLLPVTAAGSGVPGPQGPAGPMGPQGPQGLTGQDSNHTTPG